MPASPRRTTTLLRPSLASANAVSRNAHSARRPSSLTAGPPPPHASTLNLYLRGAGLSRPRRVRTRRRRAGRPAPVALLLRGRVGHRLLPVSGDTRAAAGPAAALADRSPGAAMGRG